MDAFQTYEFADGRKLELYQDDYPMDPRKEFDNLGTMACFTRCYDYGDEANGVKGHGLHSKNFSSYDDMEAHIRKENPDCVVLPIYLYDHSGCTINTTGFSCPWDSGQIGFIFITREKINKEYTEHGGRTDEQIEDYLRAEIALYDQYIRGDICGFILRDKPCEECGGEGKEIDSCWGFWGCDPMENGIVDHLSEVDKKELATLV